MAEAWDAAHYIPAQQSIGQAPVNGVETKVDQTPRALGMTSVGNGDSQAAAGVSVSVVSVESVEVQTLAEGGVNGIEGKIPEAREKWG